MHERGELLLVQRAARICVEGCPQLLHVLRLELEAVGSEQREQFGLVHAAAVVRVVRVERPLNVRGAQLLHREDLLLGRWRIHLEPDVSQQRDGRILLLLRSEVESEAGEGAASKRDDDDEESEEGDAVLVEHLLVREDRELRDLELGAGNAQRVRRSGEIRASLTHVNVATWLSVVTAPLMSMPAPP